MNYRGYRLQQFDERGELYYLIFRADGEPKSRSMNMGGPFATEEQAMRKIDKIVDTPRQIRNDGG